MDEFDIFSAVGYSAHMEEQGAQGNKPVVPYEQRETSAAPAPMVERAFRVLELLSASENGLTLSALARALSMSKGSMHTLLKTLESIKAIEQEEHRFTLGSRIYDLAQMYIQRGGLRHFALPAMRRLTVSTGETICLGKVEPQGVRIVEYMVDEEARSAFHIAAARGQRIPLLAAALGPCILASWPLAQREAFLHVTRLPQFTVRSVIDAQTFLERVEETLRTGVSFDREEYLNGVQAVGASIYGPGGVLTALIWIVGFATRFKEEKLLEAAQQLRLEAEAISRALRA